MLFGSSISFDEILFFVNLQLYAADLHLILGPGFLFIMSSKLRRFVIGKYNKNPPLLVF